MCVYLQQLIKHTNSDLGSTSSQIVFYKFSHQVYKPSHFCNIFPFIRNIHDGAQWASFEFQIQFRVVYVYILFDHSHDVGYAGGFIYDVHGVCMCVRVCVCVCVYLHGQI